MSRLGFNEKNVVITKFFQVIANNRVKLTVCFAVSAAVISMVKVELIASFVRIIGYVELLDRKSVV